MAIICLIGLGYYEVHNRPDTWWRRAGIDTGVEMFGDAHDYEVAPIQKSAGKTPKVIIENFRGDAKITGADVSEVSVTGHKTIRALDEGEANRANLVTPVEIVNDGNNIVIRCNQSKPRAGPASRLTWISPFRRGAAIEANGRQGDFQINNLRRQRRYRQRKRRCPNPGCRWQREGRHPSSDIVRCTNVKGTVDLKGRGTDVEFEKIGGQVAILGSYSGTVSMRDLAKPLRLEGMQTDLDRPKTSGQIRMERGTFNGENLEGPVQLTTQSPMSRSTDLPIRCSLKLIRATLTFDPRRSRSAKMNVRTRSGNIEIAVPESAKFELKAATDHGDIENEFGEPLKQVSHGNGAKLEGMVGTGPNLSLVTERGTVTVRKASANQPTTNCRGK